MRKILSIITAFTLLLSLFSFLPSTFQIAAAAAPDVAVTTFDGDAEAAYLADNNHFSYAKIVDSGDPERGNYAQFTINGNTDGWPQAVKLINADKTAPYEVEEGKSYYLNFDLKRVNTASNSFYIGIVILQNGNSCSNLGALQNWNITSFWYSDSNDSSWGLRRKYFTASSSGQPALVVYKTSYGEVKDAQILIDNITVVEATDYTLVNFEDEQSGFYSDPSKLGQITRVDTDDGHGKVLKYTSIASMWGAQWPQSAFICDETALASFRVKEGKKYVVTYDIKRVNATSDFTTGLFYPDNPDTGAGNPGKIENKRYSLNWFSAKSGGDWETVTAEFTAVKESTLLFVMYKDVAYNNDNQEILIDNIKISSLEGYGLTDFEEEQEEFYTGNQNLGGYMSLVDTGDDHGKAVKYTSIASLWGSKWPQGVFVCDANGMTRFKVEEGKYYRISYDLKRVKVETGFSTGLYYPPNPNSNAGNPTNQTCIGDDKNYIGWHNPGTDNGWSTVSTEFVAAKSSTVFFVIYAENEVNNQEIWVDNIRIEEFAPVNVTYHYNNGEADETLSVSVGSAYKTPSLAGAEFAGWYYDEELTQPAGSAVEEECELYAKWSSYTIDFDEKVYAQGTYNAFTVVENVGVNNTNAFRTEANTNSAWPNRFTLKNPDGSTFTVKGGHYYTLSFQVKVLEPEKLYDASYIMITDTNQSLGTSQAEIDSHKYVDIYNDYAQSQIQLKPFYVMNGMDFDGYATYKISFWVDPDTQNNTAIQITSWNVDSAVLIDNVTIKDNDAVKTVNAGGTELKGYAGDKLVLPDPDAEGNTNFVGWSETENGEYYTHNIFTKDMELYAVESQLAVVKTSADRMADTISFKVRYEDLVFSETATGITVTGITVNGIVYPINEIGLLAVPTEKLAGAALTLENADGVGAVRISNSALKYSAAADGTLEISATVSLDGQTDKYDREYTVVAYASYGASNTVYSRTKDDIASSFTKALGLNTVAAENYQHGDYKLVFNSEFGDGESLTDNWYYWTGSNSYDDLKNYSVPYEETANISDGTLNLSAKKISDTNVIKGELLSNKRFTNGYIEAKIKMSSHEASGFSFWLNSAGISENELIIKPQGDSTYVYPEIDIAEMFSGANNQISTTLHFWDFSGSAVQRQQLRIGDYDLNTAEYHTYGLERTTDKIAVFIDGTEVYSVTKQQLLDEPDDRTAEEIAAIFENPVYIILGQSITSADIDETVTTNIDYVRVYE